MANSRKPAQIVKLCAANLAGAHDVDVRNLGGMQGEATLHTYAEGKAAYSERLADPAVLLGDNNAFEVLDTLFAALDDTIADFDGVAHIELGDALFHVLGFDLFDESHFDLPPVLRDVHSRKRQRNARSHLSIITDAFKKINSFCAHFQKIPTGKSGKFTNYSPFIPGNYIGRGDGSCTGGTGTT